MGQNPTDSQVHDMINEVTIKDMIIDEEGGNQWHDQWGANYKRETKPDLIVNVQVDVDGSGLIEFHEFVKFIVGANEKILLSVQNKSKRFKSILGKIILWLSR